MAYVRPRKKLVEEQRITIKAPGRLCVYNSVDAENFYRLIERLVSTYQNEPYPITLSLQSVERITAAAAVVLFAAVTYVRLHSGKPNLVKVIPPNNSDARHVLVRSGLFVAMNRASDSSLIKLVTDGNSFSSSSNAADHFTRTTNRLSELGVVKPEALRAIQEAMLNVMHHAYDAASEQSDVAKIGKRFWQFVGIRQGRLTLILYDRGQGIPLGLSGDGVGYVSDGDRITQSMKAFVSRTGLPGRGNGSITMKKPVDTADGAVSADGLESLDYLLVHSGRGRYIYKGRHKPIDCSTEVIGVKGTLVELTISLVG